MVENENFFKSKYFYILAGIVLVLFIRLPFMNPDTTFSSQAEVYSDQIEAPVYTAGNDFVYIVTAKFFNDLLNYPLYAQYAVGVIFLITLTIAFFELQLLLGSNNHESFLFSLLFSFLTVNLASTLTGGSYQVLCLAAAAGLYNSIKVIINKQDRNILYLALFLGILSGFNNLVLPIFLPLYIYTLFKVKNTRFKLFSAGLLALSLAAWIVPALLVRAPGMVVNTLFSPFTFTLSPLLLAVNLGMHCLYTLYFFLPLFPLLIYSLFKGYYHVPREYTVLFLLILIPAVLMGCFISNFTLLLTTGITVPLFLILSASFKIDTYNKYIYTILLIIILLFQFFGLKPLPVKQKKGPAFTINTLFLQYTNLGIQSLDEQPPASLLTKPENR